MTLSLLIIFANYPLYLFSRLFKISNSPNFCMSFCKSDNPWNKKFSPKSCFRGPDFFFVLEFFLQTEIDPNLENFFKENERKKWRNAKVNRIIFSDLGIEGRKTTRRQFRRGRQFRSVQKKLDFEIFFVFVEEKSGSKENYNIAFHIPIKRLDTANCSE